jgi:deoxynucleotide monophosphate kinase-like protein
MIIGLTGYAGSGKDTVGLEFQSRAWARVSFAEPLKKLAIKINPVVEWDRDGTFYRLADVVESKGWEYAKFRVYDTRRFLQALGQGAREIFGPRFWVDLAADELQKWTEQAIDVVVTDVRYPNEAETIRSFEDGFIVYVHRPGVLPVNDHPSDRKLPEELIDSYFYNGGTIEEIPDQVGWLINHLTMVSSERKGIATVQEQIQAWIERGYEPTHDRWPQPSWAEDPLPGEDQGGNTDLAGAREEEA